MQFQFRVLIITVMLLCATPLLAREKYQSWCSAGGAQVQTGNLNSATRVMRSFPVCTITVYEAGSTKLAMLFSDPAGTHLDNPFPNQNQQTGQYFFYADNGHYDVQISATGLATYTLRYIRLNDAAVPIPCPLSLLPVIQIPACYSAMGGWAFPEWWGAVGDGVTDDSAALQAAVNYFMGGNYHGGRLSLTHTYGIANTITFFNKSIEIAGCGWSDFDRTAPPAPCGVKWIGTGDSSMKDMFVFSGCAGLWMHDIHFEGSNASPVQSVLGFTTNPPPPGAQQFNHFERIAIGPYPSGTMGGFRYGIYAYGDNANNDSFIWDNLVIDGASDSAVYISRQQNRLWTFRNIGILFSGMAGIKTAGSIEVSTSSFAWNGTDFALIPDSVLPSGSGNVFTQLVLTNYYSEASNRMLTIVPGGGVGPDISIINSQFYFGNSNTPVDDGPCGPGTGDYLHCSRLIDARGTSINFHATNFELSMGSNAPGHQPILDFSPGTIGAVWSKDVDIVGSVLGGSLTPYFLIGFTISGVPPNVVAVNEHFRYRTSSETSPQNTDSWEYWGGEGMGNIAYMVPVNGIHMQKENLLDFQTCSGTCNFDIAAGLNKLIILNGNVTSWTIPSYTLPGSGLGKLTVTMCASGGNYTAVVPAPSGVIIANWGFGATITNGTCAIQDFNFLGFFANVPVAGLTRSIYGGTFTNGIPQ